jgi:hypothetical protein
VLERERILAKVDELEGRQMELVQIAPDSIDEYQKIEKKRAGDFCEETFVRLIKGETAEVIDGA